MSLIAQRDFFAQQPERFSSIELAVSSTEKKPSTDGIIRRGLSYLTQAQQANAPTSRFSTLWCRPTAINSAAQAQILADRATPDFGADIVRIKRQAKNRIAKLKLITHKNDAQKEEERALKSTLHAINGLGWGQAQEYKACKEYDYIGLAGSDKTCTIRIKNQSTILLFERLIFLDPKTKKYYCINLRDGKFVELADIESQPEIRPIAFTQKNKRQSWSTVEKKTQASETLEQEKKTNSLSSDGATAGCCLKMSLDEISNVATAGKNDHSHQLDTIETPHGAGEIAFATTVTYFSLAGTIIGLFNIRDYYKQLIEEICDSLEKSFKQLREQELKLKELSNDGEAEKKVAIKKKQLEIQVKINFCQRQLSEALFQMHCSGELSGIASLLTLVGQFIPPVQIAGLAGHALVGLGSMINAIRLFAHSAEDKKKFSESVLEYIDSRREEGNKLSKAEKALLIKDISKLDFTKLKTDISSISDDQINYLKTCSQAIQFYDKKRATLLKNLAAWTLYTTGAAMTTAGMISMLAGAAFPPALPFIGLGLLLPGVIGAAVYNNRLSSNKFYPSLPMRIAGPSVPTQNEVKVDLEKARFLGAESKEFRRRILATGSAWKTMRHHTRRWLRYKLWIYLTVGLANDALMGQKFKVKQMRAKDFTLDAASALEYVKKFTPTDLSYDSIDSQIESDPTSDVLSTLKYDEDDKKFNDLSSSLGKLLAKTVVKQNITRRIRLVNPFGMREIQPPTETTNNNQWKIYESEHTKSYLRFIQVDTKRTLEVKPKYRLLLLEKVKKESNLDCLKHLYDAKPCCDSGFFARTIFNDIEQHRTALKVISAEKTEMMDTTITNLLKQFAVFQAPKDSKRETALWSEYLAEFARVEASQAA